MAGDEDIKRDWLKRVLGVDPTLAAGAVDTPAPPRRIGVATRAASRESAPPLGKPSGPQTLATHAPGGDDRISAPDLVLPGQSFSSADGRRLIRVAHTASGKPVLTAPPPPLTDLTFSGGGGKGAALPGAVRALEDNGLLQGVRKISGASVGSMTAVLVSTGLSAADFEQLANDPHLSAMIKEGNSQAAIKAKTVKSLLTGAEPPLSGAGLAAVVAEFMNQALRKQLTRYLTLQEQVGQPPDPVVLDVMEHIAGNQHSATFLDMRRLSKVLPAVKELVITGTYVHALPKEGDKGAAEPVNQDATRPRLYVFDADSEPDLEVTRAVQASAAFPGAFKPVSLDLSDGTRALFIDGGVLNNTPTDATLGKDRKLDALPQSRGITFVFQDSDGASKDLLSGKVKPAVGKTAQILDWAVGADNAAANYQTFRDLADRPGEIVEVPLRFTESTRSGPRERDFTGTGSGTLNFDIPLDTKLQLQDETRKVTDAQITREMQPKMHQFASESELLMAISNADLATLLVGDYPGAQGAQAFRAHVAQQCEVLSNLQPRLATADPAQAANLLEQVAGIFDDLTQRSGADPEFQAYVARECNRGALDGLVQRLHERLALSAPGPRLDAAAAERLQADPVCAATLAVRAVLDLREQARTVAMDLIYPYMKKQTDGGTGIATLVRMDEKLRAVRAVKEFNAALQLGIAHFSRKRDLPPKVGHKQFAEDLKHYLIPT